MTRASSRDVIARIASTHTTRRDRRHGARATNVRVKRTTMQIVRAQVDEDDASTRTTKRDPFGFASPTQGADDKIIPGFDTAEKGAVGPIGTFAISSLLFALFAMSFFFTSVPRDAVREVAARMLVDDPNAPMAVFR